MLPGGNFGMPMGIGGTQASAAAAANAASLGTAPLGMPMASGMADPMKVMSSGAMLPTAPMQQQPQQLGQPGSSPKGQRSPGGRSGRNRQQAAMPVQGFGMDPSAVYMQMMMNPGLMGMQGVPGMQMPFAMPSTSMLGMQAMNPMLGMTMGLPTAPLMPVAPAAVAGGAGAGRGGKGGSKGGNFGAAAGDGGKSRGGRRGGKKSTGGGGKESGASGGADVLSDPSKSEALKQLHREKDVSKWRLPIQEAVQHFLEFAKDQTGSRYIQNCLEAGDGTVSADVAKSEVYKTLRLYVVELSKDPFGYFIIQKYFDVGTPDQRKELVEKMASNMLELANDLHGCRVVQKAIQHTPRESQTLIANGLADNVISCIESQNGNHVIQKCIEQMPPDSVAFVIRAVEAEGDRMAKHMYGCRVVQRLLEHCPHQLSGMLNAIVPKVADLAVDQYGNYVVQHMLEHGRLEDKRRILMVVTDRIVEFSTHKCPSNVVEKALETASLGEHAEQLQQERALLMNKILDPIALRQLIDDKFGNFIVQRLIEHTRGSERERLQDFLRSNMNVMKNSQHGKHILNALNKQSTEG